MLCSLASKNSFAVSSEMLSKPQVVSEVRLDSVQNLGTILGKLEVNMLRGVHKIISGRVQQPGSRSPSAV